MKNIENEYLVKSVSVGFGDIVEIGLEKHVKNDLVNGASLMKIKLTRKEYEELGSPAFESKINLNLTLKEEA